MKHHKQLLVINDDLLVVYFIDKFIVNVTNNVNLRSNSMVFTEFAFCELWNVFVSSHLFVIEVDPTEGQVYENIDIQCSKL